MINAIVYSPAGAVDLEAVRERIAHIHRRGYNLAGISSDWTVVDDALTHQRAHVVLFAGAGADDAGLATQALRPPKLTREWVRDIIDNGAAPPDGIDPETIAAARRLARMVSGNVGRYSR